MGNRLNFDMSDPEQWIFFVSENDSELKVEIIGHNRPSNLSFFIPSQHVTGDYKLIVRSKTGNLEREDKLERLLSAA